MDRATSGGLRGASRKGGTGYERKLYPSHDPTAHGTVKAANFKDPGASVDKYCMDKAYNDLKYGDCAGAAKTANQCVTGLSIVDPWRAGQWGKMFLAKAAEVPCPI